MEKKYVARIFAPGAFADIGGAEKYAAFIAQYLADNYRNLDIGFVSYRRGGGRPGKIDFLNATYDLSLPESVRVSLLDEETDGKWGRYVAHRALRKTSRGVDLYINCFHNVQFFEAKKNVHIVHFPAPRRVEGSPTFGGKLLLKPLADALDRKYRDCYDLFVCNSHFSEQWLGKYWGIDPARREVLYPPASHNATWSDEIMAKKEPIILLVSRFDPRKNILEAVKFFAENEMRFAGWRLVIAGSCGVGDGAYFGHVRDVAAGHRIDIFPNLSTADLKALYRKASIFWHAMGMTTDEANNPVDVEHFGITTVEAMAAGAVPVVIDKGGQREIVEDGISGFRWKKLEELGRLTQKLIVEPDLRLAFSKAAVEKSNNYSIESFYANIDTIFREHRLIPEEYRK